MDPRPAGTVASTEALPNVDATTGYFSATSIALLIFLIVGFMLFVWGRRRGRTAAGRAGVD